MDPNKRIWTIPNILTVLRLFMLIPIMMHLSNGERYWALLWMLIGVLTDFLDGIIARKFNQRSDLGRLMDPVVDKLNVITVLIFLVISPLYEFPLWYLIFIGAREVTLMLGGLIALRGKKVVMESNRPGKNSAFANGMVVVLFVLGWQPYGWIVLTIAMILTLYSTWIYFQLYRKQVQQLSTNSQ